MTVTVTKDCVDYLSAIVPIVLSVVAIGISIRVAKQQNNIALFEKRYQTYELLQFIGDFCSNGISPFSRETIERLKNPESEEEVGEYQKAVCVLLSLWVCKRIMLDGKMSDEERTRHAVTCIKGEPDPELARLMNSFLERDRSELDKAVLLFDYGTTLIKETADAYQDLCQQMLMCIGKNKAHVVDGFYDKLKRFIDVADKWAIGSSTMDRLQKEIRL